MLVERPCPREYTYIQQGTYLRSQRIIELRRMMEQLEPFPIQKNKGYNNRVLENKPQGHLLTQTDCYAITSSSSSIPTVHNNQRYFSGGTASRGRRQSKSVCRGFTKMNHEVTAFGPKHAEHARRFYQSEGKKWEPRQVMVTPYRPNYGPTYCRQSGVKNGSNLLGDPVFNTGVNKSTKWCTMSAMGGVSLPKISLPSETVLRVAKISPRPRRMRPKTLSSVGMTILNKKMEGGLKKKSDDFQDNRLEDYLKNAPLFQILCEISKT